MSKYERKSPFDRTTSRNRFGTRSFYWGNTLEPYALECLASVAEAYGYPTEILQQGLMSIEDVVHFTVKADPFCVGLSVLTHTANHARKIAEAIKCFLPSVVIIVGGQHPSLEPNYVYHDCFDYAVVGEGEATFVELRFLVWSYAGGSEKYSWHCFSCAWSRTSHTDSTKTKN